MTAIASAAQTEREFQTGVVQYARLNGWRAYHTHNSRRSEPGFPDLVLVRDRIIYAELKTTRGKPSKDQTAWLQALADAGAETYLWRPDSWPEIVATLRRTA